jgi:Phosphatidylserine decarboxylase
MIDPKIRPGYHVTKGEELGYFQFGGSTHCLVFRPGAIADFTLPTIPQPHDPNATGCGGAESRSERGALYSRRRWRAPAQRRT